MTKFATSAQASPELNNGELEEALSALSSDPDFVAEELALAITEEIANAMVSEGISKAELARRIGASRSYVTRIMGRSPQHDSALHSQSRLGAGIDARSAAIPSGSTNPTREVIHEP